MPSRKISDLHPDFQEIAKKFLDWASEEISPWEVFITDGYRSHEEQAELYAKGRTKPGQIVTYAKPGWSWHNFGLAIDVCFRQKPGEALWKVDNSQSFFLSFHTQREEGGFKRTPFPHHECNAIGLQ